MNCVLLIDDDEPTNFFTRLILEEVGFTDCIQVAQSGEEALNYLRKSQSGEDPKNFPFPDLILLDINMPAMDGWEFLDEYKKMEKANPSVIIMLTTSLFPEDKAKALGNPEIAAFENKPITPEKVTGFARKFFPSIALSS